MRNQLERLKRTLRERPRQLATGGYIETRDKHVRIVYRTSALRLAAWAVLAVTAFGAINLCGGIYLRERRMEVVQYFHNSRDYDELGIAHDLDVMVQVSHNLVTVARRYLPADDEYIFAVEAARGQLNITKNMRDVYQNSAALIECADALINRLEGMAVSEQDARYLRGFAADLRSSEVTISLSPYNAYVEAYNELLTGFPGGMIAFVNRLECAEKFGPAE